MLINVWCWWDSNRGSLLPEATALPHFHECQCSFEPTVLLRALLSCTTQLKSVKVEKRLFEIKTERSKSFFATHFPAKSCRQKKFHCPGKKFLRIRVDFFGVRSFGKKFHNSLSTRDRTEEGKAPHEKSGRWKV